MIETNYDFTKGYHTGPLVQQDALAYLGVFKTLADVPKRYRLSNFVGGVDAEAAWEHFMRECIGDVSEHTRKYVYGKAWREWIAFCSDTGIHPALAQPQHVESHLQEQCESVNKLKTAHDARFRPLFRWYRWMQFHTEYPHRYNPTIMAVLMKGATYEIWSTRIEDRQYAPLNNQ